MLFFKNIIIYQLNKEIELSDTAFEKQLSAYTYLPCSPYDRMANGWVAPIVINENAPLSYQVSNHTILRAAKEEKIVPAHVINLTLQEKIKKLETIQKRKLTKTERETLKDEVMHELLPRAFSKVSHTWLWLDKKNNFIIVDAASYKRAEDILALLRKSLGSLPVTPLSIEYPIAQTLTEWIKSAHLPEGLTLEDEAELKSTLDDGIIRCKKQELHSEEILSHITAGKLVTRLALNWQDRIRFILDENGTLKRIKFSELAKSNLDEGDSNDPMQLFDADVILMTSELSLLINSLISVLTPVKNV